MNICNDGKGLVFNIVFTKNTFYYFCYLTRTILSNSSVKVRIVLNGCNELEQAKAIKFSEENEGRVFVINASNEKVLTHHESIQLVLDEDDDSEFFCFADSDIFARGQFMPIFAEVKGSPGMICSGDTIWTENNTITSKRAELWGRFYFNQSGWTYGSSYFCIYKRTIVRKIMQKYGVDFRRYDQEEIPMRARKVLIETGHDYIWYDTAKVLNILMAVEGNPIVHVPNNNLVHVGGMSWYLSLHREDYEKRVALERRNAGMFGFLKRSKIDPRLGISTDTLRLDFAEYASQILISGVEGGTKSIPDIPKHLAQGHHSSKVHMLRREMLRMLERDNP